MIKALVKFTLVVGCCLLLFKLFLDFAYKVQDEGELYLKNAPGVAAILREEETGIQHIRGDSELSVVYAQGFAHAQTRLW